MGLDNKLIFPDFQTLTLDKDNPTVYYTREASGEIYRIDGRSEVKQETTWKKGFMVSADGYVQNSANTALEGAINISNFTTPLTIRLGNTIPTYNTVVFLNSEKLHISTVNYADLNALEIPSGAKYLKLSYNHAVHSGIKEPEVYINDVLVYGINEVANVGLLNVSTNKYDINITSSKNYTLGLINEGDYDVYVDTKYNNYFIKNIPVVTNSKITIAKGSARNIQFTIYKYDANRVEGYGAVIEQIYGNVDIQTISIPSNCESITLLIRDTTEHPTGLYLQEGDKFVDYVQTSTKTISIEQPLRQANDNVYDSIYRFGDGGYYLFKRVGVRSYQDGDYDNPLVITDGVNTNYDLGIADYTEVQLTDFDPSIDFFGTDTTFSCDSMMPSIEVKVPIDYAYNESKRKYVDEEINIDTVDVDSRKDIEIVSIEGQTYENLLQEPLVQGTAINPVELTGRECVYTGGENRTVPLREITGDTYINLLEDKIERGILKPSATYTNDIIDGTSMSVLTRDSFIIGDISNETGEYVEASNGLITPNFITVNKASSITLTININIQIRIFQYDANKKFISSFNPNNTDLVRNLELADNVSFIKLKLGTATNNINVSFSSIPYNFNTGDKIVIDEIKGNTKLYYEAIPVADRNGNIYTSPIEIKGNNILESNYIYVGDVKSGESVYFKLYEDGVSTSITGHGITKTYDENLQLINSNAGYCNLNGITAQGVANNVKYFKVSFEITSGELDPTKTYNVCMKFASRATSIFPETYEPPVLTGVKTFPIQSVGELYVDDNGSPILDENNNEQYKINIISSNNIWDGKKFNTKYSNGASGFGDPSYYNSVKLQDNYSMKITKSQATTRFYSGTIIVDNILNYSKLYASCRYINDNGLKNNSQIWWCDFYDVSGNYLSQARQSIPVNSSNLYQASFDVPSGAYTARWAMQGDINEYISAEFYITDIKITYNKEKTVTPITTTIESILLPQPLRGISDRCDSLVWNNETSKYEIIPRVKKLVLDDSYVYVTNWGGATDKYAVFILNLARVPDLARPNDIGLKNIICDKLPSYDQSLFSGLEANGICITNHPAIYIKVNIEEFGLSSNNDVEGFKTWLRNNGGLEIYYQTTDNTAIETNITKPITIPCYDNTTAIYTSGTSSHDNVNNPYLEQLKGEITCTTLPLSTTAYIKPSTQYTMFMNTDCDVNYSLGGIEKEYKPTNGLKNNIMKKEYWLDNTTIDGNTGEASSNSLMMGTDFIPVIPNDTLNFNHVTLNRYIQVYGYGKDKDFIKNLWNGSTNFKITVPSDVYYIRFYGAKDIDIGMTSENIVVKSEKEYSTQGKILITTPSTLSNNTLTLLGEGNIGNVTLLEGDYTNSYVPDTFINDVFSVGELQEDGSYKVDIVSKNNTVNIFNEDMFREIPPKQVIDGFDYYINSTNWGSLEGNSTFHISGNFKENTQYTFHYDVYNTANTWANVAMVHADGTEYVVSSSNRFITSKPNKTLKAIYIKSGMMTSGVIGIGKVQIEEGVEISEYVKPVKKLTPIYLPCQLMKVGDIKDRFYWDNNKGKMCIEKNIVNISHRLTPDGIDLTYIGSGSGCGEVHYTIKGAYDIKINSRVICDKLVSFNNKKELISVGIQNNIEGIVANDGGSSVVIISFNRNNVKTLDKESVAKWFNDNNIVIRAYVLKTPQIIETNITKPIEIDLFDTETSVTTISTVEPNLYMRSDALSRPVTIKPSTKYYVHAKTTGDITVNLGGSEIQYTSSDIVKEITTPSNVTENIIEFVGNCEVSNVMLRTDNRTDIKYFNGVIYASILQDDGNYKTTINIMSNNSEEYDSFINIITSSPLESGSKIVVVDNQFKLLKANGEYEDIVSTDGNVVIDSNCKKICSCGEVNGITSLIVPYRSVRPLKAPINISFNNYTDNDNHTFVWDTDVGVEGHKFYYKDELVATIENPDPTYTYPSEMEGYVKIVAFNTLTESQGAVEDIITLPNRSEIVALNTIYDNGYKFTIVFNDNSNIRKGYKFIYSVDDGEENVIDIPVSDKAITLSQSIDVSEVSNNMKVRINSYNSVGEAEMKEKVFYLTPTPKWAYLLSSDNLMFRHQDKFPFTTYYKIKATNTQTLEENEYSYGSNQGINGLIIDYLLKSNREEELSVMLTMNDGYLDHIPCVPFKVSKTLDLSLVAPQNFTMEWVGDGIAKFSWDDNYTNEDYFEFVYSLNGGIEEVVKIYPDDVVGTGGRVSYTYKFDGFGILTGRVRMVWELNTSEYTDSKTATFVAVTGLPPAWIVKEYSGDNLVITWEAQSYVDHYEIMIECDGEVEILTEKKDMFYLDLKKYHGKYVSISIKTHFTTGLVTEYSDSILFKPVSTSGITNQMTYAPIKVEKDDNVSVYTKLADGYTSYQRITGIITNSNLLYNKFCKDMLTNSASFNNVFYHLVNHEYKDFVSVKTDNVSIESLIRILNYAHINQDGHLNTFVYTPITSSHTDFVDIQKVTIVCIGDSITAGHPHFWAESMTGDIESQYPYWLSKRLNNVYDVINKGFGSDRTYNVLARFKADVLDLNPQYCIIQAGTND